MQKINLILGAVSLVIGLGLAVASIYEGIKPLGLILGSLLLLNGSARLWLRKQRKASMSDTISKQKLLPHQQD